MNPQFRRAATTERLDLLVCEPLSAMGVPHGFSLRWRQWGDGRADEPFGIRGRGRSDRKRLARALGLSRVVRMRQIHGDEVRVVAEPPDEPLVCDGLATGEKDLALVVSTADCVPLIFWDEGQGAAGVVHAGWRGALAGVARRAMERLKERFGTGFESVHVALGPAIGACCYEVGDEVVEAFEFRFGYAGDLFSPGQRERSHLNLVEANRRQLREIGVPAEQIYSADMCTACENDRLYSFRKEGNGVGRIMGAIGILDS